MNCDGVGGRIVSGLEGVVESADPYDDDREEEGRE